MATRKDRIVDTDWSALTLGQRIQHLEVEGYVVLPDLLDSEHVERLRAETARMETVPRDYSIHQRGRPSVQFWGGPITELIAHPPAIAFLKALFGDEIIMMSYGYDRSEPGHTGISLHSDGQPWGSRIFGYNMSCPRLVRVLYYLEDLTPEVSPFKVVPRSHLSFHNDGNPYLRYEEHPEQVMVTCKAGSAALINQNVFHGNHPNVGAYAREMLAIAYRPAWVGPGNAPIRPSGHACGRTGRSGHRLPRPGCGPHAPGPPRSPPGDGPSSAIREYRSRSRSPQTRR